jgi:hypothetical protein
VRRSLRSDATSDLIYVTGVENCVRYDTLSQSELHRAITDNFLCLSQSSL